MHAQSHVVLLFSCTGLRIGLGVPQGTTDAQEADALGHMDQDIMISSNSWGPSDDGFTFTTTGPLVSKTLQTGALKVNK